MLFDWLVTGQGALLTGSCGPLPKGMNVPTVRSVQPRVLPQHRHRPREANGPSKRRAIFERPNRTTFCTRSFFVGVLRCFVSLYGVIESALSVFHSPGMITFTRAPGSGCSRLFQPPDEENQRSDGVGG